MDLKDFMPSLKDVLGAVDKLAPIVGALGGPAVSNLADLAATGAAIGRNVLARVDEGKAVMAEPDQKEVKKIVDRLAAVNDDLAGKIAAS